MAQQTYHEYLDPTAPLGDVAADESEVLIVALSDHGGRRPLHAMVYRGLPFGGEAGDAKSSYICRAVNFPDSCVSDQHSSFMLTPLPEGDYLVKAAELVAGVAVKTAVLDKLVRK